MVPLEPSMGIHLQTRTHTIDKITWIASALIFVLVACESPFRIKPKDGNAGLLQVQGALSRTPITDSSFVVLTWPVLAFDDFLRLEIARHAVEADTVESDASWILRHIIADSQTTSWQDTIYDDLDILYRLTVYTAGGQAGFSEYRQVVPLTTRLVIQPGVDPLTDKGALEWSLQSPIVDAGDTVALEPGYHFTTRLDLTDKPGLVIQGIGAAAATIIVWYEPPPTKAGRKRPWFMFKLRDSVLESLTIRSARGDVEGGAVSARGKSLFRQCIFIDNKVNAGSTESPPSGGAIYMHDNARIENCLFVDNTASLNGGAIYIAEDVGEVSIVNCTFSRTLAYGRGQAIANGSSSGQIEIMNCIFDLSGDEALFPSSGNINAMSVTYSLALENWLVPDSTNLVGNAAFINAQANDFHLLRESPAADAGNPDPAYNDPDGSRNNMGAYGGPDGNW